LTGISERVIEWGLQGKFLTKHPIPGQPNAFLVDVDQIRHKTCPDCMKLLVTVEGRCSSCAALARREGQPPAKPLAPLSPHYCADCGVVEVAKDGYLCRSCRGAHQQKGKVDALTKKLQEEKEKLKALQKPCAICGTMFVPATSRTLYCSPQCVTKAGTIRSAESMARLGRKMFGGTIPEEAYNRLTGQAQDMGVPASDIQRAMVAHILKGMDRGDLVLTSHEGEVMVAPVSLPQAPDMVSPAQAQAPWYKRLASAVNYAFTG